MPSQPPKPLQIARLLSLVRSETGRDFDKAAFQQICGAMSEALSVALLVPLLHLMAKSGNVLFVTVAGHVIGINLLAILAAFVILIGLRAYALERKEAFNARVTYGFAESMHGRLFSALAATRWSVISGWRTSDMAQAVNADSDRLIGIVTLLLSLVQSAAMAVILTMLSLFISWEMTLVAIVVGAFLLLSTMPARRRSLQRGRDLASARQAQYRLTDEFFSGLRTAKAFGLEALHVASMKRVIRRIRKGHIAFMASRAETASIYQICTAVAMAGFVYFALELAALSLPKTVALLFLYMRLAPRIIMLHSTSQDILGQIGTLENILGMLDTAERHAEVPSGPPRIAIRLRQAVELRNARFSYSGAPQPAIYDIHLRIPAGEITALVGPTGSGKSTLVDMILGLIEPDEGQVLIDGEVLSPDLVRSWQRRISYVPQETFLFNATIGENLRVANPRATESDLWDALALADAAPFVRALAEGLGHRVGDRGRSLSGGERQRLAIARALVRKPDLLILDEATSALDALSQRRVAEAIRSKCGDMTVIAVAHRTSMVTFADHVVVLENGTVTESGPLSGIIGRQGGLVREMIDADAAGGYIAG